MKMSDVFNGDIVQDADTLLADGYGELADFSGYKKEARYVAHAINNHDKLVEALSKLIEPAGMYSQLLRNHPRMATEADKIEANASDAFKLLKELGHEI